MANLNVDGKTYEVQMVFDERSGEYYAYTYLHQDDLIWVRGPTVAKTRHKLIYKIREINKRDRDEKRNASRKGKRVRSYDFDGVV